MATRSDQDLTFSNLNGGMLDLARIGNEAAGIQSNPNTVHVNFEDPTSSQTQEQQSELPQRPLPRLFNRMKNFVRRVTNTEYNPHTILNNDFSSVNEDDLEGVAVLPRTRDQIVSFYQYIFDKNYYLLIQVSSSSSRSLIMEPLPQRSRSPSPQSSDSEVEVINQRSQPPESQQRDSITPPTTRDSSQI